MLKSLDKGPPAEVYKVRRRTELKMYILKYIRLEGADSKEE